MSMMLYRPVRDRMSRAPFQLLAAVIIAGVAAVSWVGGDAVPAASPSAQAPLVAEFTGEFDRGIPVYRLPSISVSASRSAVALDAQHRDSGGEQAVGDRDAKGHGFVIIGRPAATLRLSRGHT